MKNEAGIDRNFVHTNMLHINARCVSRCRAFFGRGGYHVALKDTVLFSKLFDASSVAKNASETVTPMARLLANAGWITLLASVHLLRFG